MRAEDARVRTVLAKLGLGSATEVPSSAAFVYPSFVLTGLVIFGGVTLIGTLRTGTASSGPRAGRPFGATALIALAVVLELVLMPRAGFVIASTTLFWLTTQAFDRRHPVRDAMFATAISTAAYLLFVRVLNVPLPAGPLPF
jgi:putative tricarboxylic transport membrane protein